MLVVCTDVWRRVVEEMVLMSKGWNELDRRERPILPKTFILLTVIETVLVVVGAIYTLAEEPGDRYGRFLWMLTVVGAGFLLYFGCDAVFKENLILLIVFNIGCAIITARLWFIFVSEFMTDGYAHEITEGAILAGVTICQLSYLLLSKAMADDFGRHAFLTVGAKLHIVNLYRTFQYWLGALKADFQVTSMVLIISVFYFDISYPLQITLGLYMLCLLGVYIATVRWVELENRHFLTGFMIFSLVQPVLSILGVVKLNSSHETLRSDVAHHIQIIDGDNETTSNHSTEGVTSALILINTTVGLCGVVRCIMLWALYRTIRGFGKGLTEALHKTETCAILRSDTDDWALIDQATGFETYHQDGTSSRRTPTPPPCQTMMVGTTYPEEDTPLEKVRATSYAVSVALE